MTLMDSEFERDRNDFLSDAISTTDITYEQVQEINLLTMKKYVEYVFSNEYRTEWENERLRGKHPALQDLYDQYKTMEALLKKEDEK